MLLLAVLPAVGEVSVNAEVPTPEEIKATEAAVKKQGPRVPLEIYRKVVPAFLSKTGEPTPQGRVILGLESVAGAVPDPGQEPEKGSRLATSGPSPVLNNGTSYAELVGKWKTGASATAHTYEFKANGDVTRYFHVFTGRESENTKYAGVKTEEFHAEEKDGKIVVTPKGKSGAQEWFTIDLPFDPKAPAPTFFRVRNGEVSEIPFTFVSAAPPTDTGTTATGTSQRTVAQGAIIIGPQKRRYLAQGVPVEVSQDRANLPKWASEIVFRGRGGQPDERWLFPTDLLTDGEPYQKPSQSFNPVFPPSKRLESQYVKIAEPLVVFGSKGRNFVLMPGAQLRAIKRAQTGERYDKVPGVEVRDRDGLSTILPESAFENRAAGFGPLPSAVTVNLVGDGTEKNPFLIRTKQEFIGWCRDRSKWNSGVHSRLECDIDLSGMEFDEPLVAPLDRDDGLSPDERPNFRGAFDGNGKKITGLQISTDRPYAAAAFFQEVGPGGALRDLTVEAAVIKTLGLNSGAAILCFTNKGLIENCRVTGVVTTESGLGSGGLCVENRESGEILGSQVGGDGKTTISGWQAGSLCSTNEGSIERSVATADIRGNQSGGLTSVNGKNGSIRNCLAAGRMVDSANVGGFVMENQGTVENCFSRTQLIPGKNTKISGEGGMVAKNRGGARVVSSFWDLQAWGAAEGEDGTGISTAQRREQATFRGWDFTGVWTMGETGPELRKGAVGVGKR